MSRPSLLERRDALLRDVETYFQQVAENPEHEFVIIAAGGLGAISGRFAIEASSATVGNVILQLFDAVPDAREYVLRALMPISGVLQ